ncbi:TonB-dependent receptor [Hymenobacter sp.]|uniref:TonB-dependent receptor n=1 Tax=Hymenobacter sp. TaxID=1898978 RepID=UPI00286C36C9|nr:TonB-dependent receptor [Hymenobacter sp.]
MPHSLPFPRHWRPALALVCATALSPIAHAQTNSNSSVTGLIKDGQGQTLAGATVVLTPGNIGTATDNAGEFTLRVPAGSYTATVSFLGYKPATQPLTVAEGGSATVNAALAEDPLLMEGVVVTGTFNPQSKLESSTAVTTLNARQIQTRVSRGTADLLMAVPGFRVNSDGGEAANSVSARGLPANAESGFGFLQLLEDGLPLLEVGGLTFAKSDIHMRVDETLDRLEVVRGGSAGIQANNAPGGLINFLSKTGNTGQIGGTVKFTGGDQGFYSDRSGFDQVLGLQRVDANVGGPIKGTPLRFNVGGFFRKDDGTKYAGYTQNRGGQVKANVTYTLKNGYVRLYGKYLNDRVAYLTSIPYQNLNNPQQIPGGPDLRRGTMYSEFQRFHSLPNPFNNGEGTLNRDLADGQHSRYKSVSSEVFFDLGNGFTLQDNARVLDANLSTDGVYDLLPPFAGINLGLTQSLLGGYGGLGANGFELRYADNNALVASGNYNRTTRAITQTGGDFNFNGNGLVNIAGIFPDDKPATNAINKLQISKTTGGHHLSGGWYASRYNIKERLSYNQILQEVANRPRLLNLTLTTSTRAQDPSSILNGTPIQITQNGFYAYSFGTAGGILANTDGTTQINSLFLGDEWTLSEKLHLDLGMRYERSHNFGRAGKSSRAVNLDPRYPFLNSAANPTGANGGLDGDYTTIYDNSYLQNTGEFRTWDYVFETVNGSIGANYKLDPRTAIYARYSNSGVVPTNDQWAFGADPADPTGNSTVRGAVQRVQQAEVGVKASTDRLGLGLTAFYSRNENIPFTIQQANADGSFTLNRQRGSVQNAGLEGEITYQPVAGLTLRGIGTLQTPRIVEFQQLDETGKLVSIAGNRLEDTPDALLEGGFEYSRAGFDVFSNYRWFGNRYANRRNTILLPSYGVLFGGVGYNFAGSLKGVRLSVQGSNLLNALGFGDAAARNGENSAASSQAFIDNPTLNAAGKTPSQAAFNLVRPILPRNITASVGYSF